MSDVVEDALTLAMPTLRAFGEPTRARIVSALLSRGGTATVSELQGLVGLPQSTVSRQLRVLLDSRLVTVERDGSLRRYQLAVQADQLDAIEALVVAVRACQTKGPTSDLS